jgi:hypothetical protein
MNDTKTTQPQPVKQDTDSDTVSRAAAELGVEVPRGFQLVGFGEDRRHICRCAGSAADFRVAAAICRRLDEAPVADCWIDSDRSGDERPAWLPPADWTDTEAVFAYLVERQQHPEWPRFSNSWADFLLGVGSNAVWDGLKWMVLRVRAGHPEMSREDAILVGKQALAAEFVRLGLEPPNVDAMTCRADQLMNGNWSLLFYSQHIVVRLDVSAADSAEGRGEVTILTCIHGIGGQ